MAPPNNPVEATTAAGGTPAWGVVTDVYQRAFKATYMTENDIENLETKINDKDLFQNIAIFLFGASAPEVIDKGAALLNHAATPVDMSILLICVVAVIGGGFFQYIANRRRKQVKAFKTTLFNSEKHVFRSVFFDSQSGTPVRVNSEA
jgi:hypothetical protein